MRGLVPRIHVLLLARKTWMAGTSPAMTGGNTAGVLPDHPRPPQRRDHRGIEQVLIAAGRVGGGLPHLREIARAHHGVTLLQKLLVPCRDRVDGVDRLRPAL